jgi:hypothetical protein
LKLLKTESFPPSQLGTEPLGSLAPGTLVISCPPEPKIPNNLGAPCDRPPTSSSAKPQQAPQQNHNQILKKKIYPAIQSSPKNNVPPLPYPPLPSFIAFFLHLILNYPPSIRCQPPYPLFINGLIFRYKIIINNLLRWILLNIYLIMKLIN